MNAKAKGEKGERIAIGELAKWNIDVAIPLTDNLRFDFIIVYNHKLFKVQVKSSSRSVNNGSVEFALTSNNWHKKTKKKYYESDCDIMILCDYDSVYLLSAFEFTGRSGFTIRKEVAQNGQTNRVNLHDDYVLSRKRIEEVLGR